MLTAAPYIQEAWPVIRAEDTVAQALAQLSPEDGISALPVVHDAQLVGLFTEAMAPTADPTQSVDEQLPQAPFRGAVHENASLLQVFKTLAETGLKQVPACDTQGRYLGMIHLDDALHGLGKLLGLFEEGGALLLRMRPQDYSLSKLARIAEEHRLNIIGVYTARSEELDQLQVLLRLNDAELSPYVASLERHGYLIDQVFAEGPQLLDTHDRYDALMRYINV